MQNKVALGNHQEVHLGNFKMDRRGLISGSAQRHRQGEDFLSIDVRYFNLTAAPGVGLPCVGVERDYDEGKSMAIYTYTYEGIMDGIDPDANAITFELDITMEEAGIEAHPNLAAIETKYGKFDRIRRKFPAYLPNTTGTGSTGLAAGQTAKKTLSPLAATDSYLVFGATFKKSYVRKVIPSSILFGIGTSLSSPPGIAQFPLPPAAKYREWLKLAPKITKRGNCVQIEENFLMSGRRGIVQEIYGSAQLEEQPAEES